MNEMLKSFYNYFKAELWFFCDGKWTNHIFDVSSICVGRKNYNIKTKQDPGENTWFSMV